MPSVSVDDVRIEKSRRHLLPFTTYTHGSYLAGWFHRELCARLEQFLADVVAGKSPRLLIFAPPRHGKSEAVVRRFPAWSLGKCPDLQFLVASYAASLADAANRDTQTIMSSPRYRSIFPDTRLPGEGSRTGRVRQANYFEVLKYGGSYRSAGCGGGITGHGMHVGIIDDPLKDHEEASSQTIRDKRWDWYRTTFYTRLAPGAGVLLIQTRWHYDDLAGRCLEQMEKQTGDVWDVVQYPAIAEDDEPFRRKGEALHPERYSADALEKIRIVLGPRSFEALYQQRPGKETGNFFKRENWRYYTPTSTDPQQLIRDLGITYVVASWDTAFKTDEQKDYSSWGVYGVGPNRYYVLDAGRDRLEFPELKRAMVALHAKWRPSVTLVEDKASGQSAIQELRRPDAPELSGLGGPFAIVAVDVEADKVARANAASPIHEAGCFYLPTGAPWEADFVSELAQFPNGKFDDQVDQFVQAVLHLSQGQGGMGIWGYIRAQAEAALQARTPAPPAGTTQEDQQSPWHRGRDGE